jgi:hypothetical protein
VGACPDTCADYESWGDDAFDASWLSVNELCDFDYEAPCADGISYSEFLGSLFFEELDALRNSGASRVVFWFEN